MGRPPTTPNQTEDYLLDFLRAHLTRLDSAADEERVQRITRETIEAFATLAGVRRAVSIFGSAQEDPAARWGARVRETAALLAREGFAVITGGGPGLMAAANQGAQEAGGGSIGLTIDLPDEEVNAYVTLRVPFHYFFLRKLMFVKYACAFVCFPGGFGTLDELFEALNLVKTHKLAPFPVLMFGSRYWHGLRDWLRDTAVREGCLADADLDLLEITDEPEHVMERVRQCHTTLCRRLGIES